MVEYPAKKLSGFFMRFTIRDLMWLMLAVSILSAWLIDHRMQLKEQVLSGQRCTEIQREKLAEIKKLQEANQILEYREREREIQEKIRKIEAGELPPPP
jgi:hypothetical protein